MSAIPCPVCCREMAAPNFDAVFHGVNLTPAELDIMKLLWNRQGMHVSTERIVDWLYQLDSSGSPEHAVKGIHVRMHHIRNKLPNHLRVWNKHGHGYRLEVVQ